MLRFFGLSQSGSDPASTKPAPSRSLPSSWYRSPAMYELERRAIFSQRWVLITHTLRFAKAGDFLSFTHAGFSFFLVQDRDGNINGFHNLCRHRAYPIVEAASGCTKILSCKYHGWSYGFKGNLAKAPRFDTVEGFDKSQHGLLPIHVHVDKAGFIWVNMEAGTETNKWETDFSGADTRIMTTSGITDFGEFTFDHCWDMDLDANWKGVIDNYNECYHCPTSHPLIAGASDMNKYRIEPNAGCLEHTIVNKDATEADLKRSITFFYPSTSVTVTPNFFYIQRMIPVTATTSRIENEVFRHKKSTDEQFASINQFYHQVLQEDKMLCDGAQKNLNSGVYVNGELHPQKEKGPLHFQDTVRRQVMDHREEEERRGGTEMWPAVPKAVGEMETPKLDEEELFCAKLEAANCMSRNPEVVW